MADTWHDILRIAKKLEPRLRKEFLAAVEKLRKRLPVASIVKAASAEPMSAALMASFREFEQDLANVVATTRQGLQDAGDSATQGLAARVGGATMRFDITNPFAVEAARTQSAALITNITEETRLAVRALVHRAFVEQLQYRELARLVRQSVGLTRTQALALMNFQRELMAEGLTGHALERNVRAYAQRQLQQRSLMIARTELMTAANAGQQAAWQQAVAAGRLDAGALQEWLVTPDDRLCVRCRAMSGARVPVGSHFRPRNPPLHPHCRCTVILRLPTKPRRVA